MQPQTALETEVLISTLPRTTTQWFAYPFTTQPCFVFLLWHFAVLDHITFFLWIGSVYRPDTESNIARVGQLLIRVLILVNLSRSSLIEEIATEYTAVI